MAQRAEGKIPGVKGSRRSYMAQTELTHVSCQGGTGNLVSFVPRSQCELALMCARLPGWLHSNLPRHFSSGAVRLSYCKVKGNAV